MVKAMYSGVAGLRAHQSKMDVIGNNIANVSTWGYKSMDTSFKESVYQSMIASSAGSTNNGSYGGVNPSKIGYGSMVSAISSNFTSGNQVPTGGGLDCYIEGVSFFAVGPIYGDGEAKEPADIELSRVGNFGIINGYLVDANGRYVYGYNVEGSTSEVKKDANGDLKGPELEGYGNPDPDKGYVLPDGTTEFSPIKLPTMYDDNGTDVEMKLTSFSINQDGMIYGVDDKSGKTVLLGAIALVSVVNPNGLDKTSGPYYKTSGASGEGDIIQAGGKAGTLLGGFLESANVDIANEFSNMITTQRGFQANSRIITVTDEMLQELVNLKR